MLPPQACVAIEIAGPPAAAEQRAALEGRCSDILRPRRCRVITPPDGELGGDAGTGCWHAQVTATGGGTPAEAVVVLSDDSDPTHPRVRRDIAFRPNDAVVERWATLGLVIAALVTVEEHSAAEETGPLSAAAAASLGSGVPTARVEAPSPAQGPAPMGSVRASGVAALGLLPGAAFGARLEAFLARRHVGMVARATIFPEHNRVALGAAGAGGAFQLKSAGVGACWVGVAYSLDGRVCAGGDLINTRARGFGVAQTTSAAASSEAVWTGALVEWRLLSHLALTFEAEAALLLERPTFAIEGAPGAFTPSPIAAAAGLGLAVPF
jgi:hypothetical protein